MSRLPIYSNVSRWVFSGGHTGAAVEPEYGYVNYMQDWNSGYLRPFNRYDRIGRYFSAPFGFTENYHGYMPVSAYYSDALFYRGRAPRIQYDRIYDKPVHTKEKDKQKQKAKEKHEITKHGAYSPQGRPRKHHRVKSNKKIQMYQNWNVLEPPTTSESSYPVYMIPKSQISYQNYMQESSFYGDDDDGTFDSGSQGHAYQQWHHDSSGYRMKRGDQSSGSSHTSYQNHGAHSDILEEASDVNKDEEEVKKETPNKQTSDKVLYENSGVVRTLTVNNVEKTTTNNIPIDSVRKDPEYENTQPYRISDATVTETGTWKNNETDRHSDSELVHGKYSENTETFRNDNLEDCNKLTYENIGTSRKPETESSKNNLYENTQERWSEIHTRKNVYEDIQIPTNPEAENAWNIYDNITPVGLIKRETHKRSEYHYIHPTAYTADNKEADLENVNRKEYAELETQTIGTKDKREYADLDSNTALENVIRKEYIGLEAHPDVDLVKRKEYPELQTPMDVTNVNRKEYFKVENTSETVNQDFDRVSEDKLAQIFGYQGYGTSQVKDPFEDAYLNEDLNVGYKKNSP